MGEAILLPHGYWLDGRHCREVSLRPLTGRDEEFLLGDASNAPLVMRVTELLTRCIQRMAGRETVSRGAVADLVAGDREALLLQLRRLTLGEQMQATLLCPAEKCGKPMDLSLSIDALLQAPYSDAQAEYECEQQGLHFHFRLPTGSDLEAVCGDKNSAQAAEKLLHRCMTGVYDGSTPFSEWPADCLEDISTRMEALDPQAELRLDVVCPECGEQFPATLDTAAYLLEEIAAHANGLYRQVHSLALHYHWSEAEILSLSPIKRHRYLGLLADSLSEAETL